MTCIDKMICQSVTGFENGSGPTWCQGNSTILRLGENVFATNMRLCEERRGSYTSVSLELYAKRGSGEWQLEYADKGIFQREPCPMLCLGENRIGVTVNPCDITGPAENPRDEGVESTPKLYVFDVSGPAKLERIVTLRWDDPAYCFVVHSYRSCAVDQTRGDLFFDNQYHKSYSPRYREEDEGSHCYTLMDREFHYLRSGKLPFPERSCYQNICMKDGECYIFALKDIIEPVQEWKAYKLEKTGNVWDYDFRVLYLLYCPDIRTADFEPARVIADRDSTAGMTRNLDCAYDENGDVWMVYSTKQIWHDFMRDRFFPEVAFSSTLELVQLRRGKEINRQIIDRSEEWDGQNPQTSYYAQILTGSSGKLNLIWLKGNASAQDKVENGMYLYDPEEGISRLVEEPSGEWQQGDMPASTIFGSLRRLGAQPCDIADLYWMQTRDTAGRKAGAIMHREIRLGERGEMFMQGTENRKTPLDYARQACDTLMRKFDAADLPPKGRFHYHQGVFLSGMYQTYEQCKEEKYFQYMKDWVDSIIDENGDIHTFNPVEMDDIQPGVLLYPLLAKTGEEKYRKALEILVPIFQTYPRNKEGGFWHKDVCPEQMWLDGLYMGGPICAEYAYRFGQPQYWDIVTEQALLMREKTEDKETGLWYHAYDSIRQKEWADPETGLSAEFWGRSIGWVPVAILNELDFIPQDYEKRPQLEALVRDLLQAVCRYQSEEGRWYQVVNKGGQAGNWLENSCSCLYTAAICKAVRKGILEESYLAQAKKGYEAVIASLEYEGEDVLIGHVCIGTGVGDYQHYCNRPVSVNDLHGVGAFLIMCTEVPATF